MLLTELALLAMLPASQILQGLLTFMPPPSHLASPESETWCRLNCGHSC